MRRALALLLISAAALAAAPSVAVGGEEEELDVELASQIEPLTFTATFGSGTCEQGEFDYELEANGDPITPISATQSSTDSDLFTFVLPSGTPPGELGVFIECDNGDGSTQASGFRLWASMPVTKVVSGPAPSTAAFTVHLACEGDFDTATSGDFQSANLPESFTADLQYGAVGGVKYAYTDHGVLCTVTEPVNGGATSVTISPQVIDSTPDPGLYPGTVTNTFAAAIQPNFTG